MTFTRVCPKKDSLQLGTGEECIIQSDLKDRLICSKHTTADLPENHSLFKAIKAIRKFEKNVEILILLIILIILTILISANSSTEAATRGVQCKKMFLEISQNSQENTCANASFLIKAWGLQLH